MTLLGKAFGALQRRTYENEHKTHTYYFRSHLHAGRSGIYRPRVAWHLIIALPCLLRRPSSHDGETNIDVVARGVRVGAHLVCGVNELFSVCLRDARKRNFQRNRQTEASL